MSTLLGRGDSATKWARSAPVEQPKLFAMAILQRNGRRGQETQRDLGVAQGEGSSGRSLREEALRGGAARNRRGDASPTLATCHAAQPLVSSREGSSR